MKIAINEIEIPERFRKDIGDLTDLIKSISEIGLLHPVVINENNQLVAGQRRLLACKKLGWQEIPATLIDLDNLVRGEHDENTIRKDFTPSEAVAIWEAMEKYSPPGKKVSKLDTNSEKRRNRASKAVGISPASLSKAKQVVEAAKQEPEKYQPLLNEMDKTGRVSGVHKKLKVAKQKEEINKEPPPLPKGPFRVIAVDPPWTYGRSNDSSHRSSNPYPSLSIDEIKSLPIPELSHDDSILWLWTTNAHIRIAFEIMEHWGFEYKTLLTWEKDKMGTGDWLRGKTEHCLMGIKGKPTVTLTNQTTSIHGPSEKHSAKPNSFYKLVENLCPGSKLDFFARQERPGWRVYGDEIQ